MRPILVQVGGLSVYAHGLFILLGLLTCLAVLALRDHPRLQGGNLLKLGLGGYALFRFGVEFVRTNRVLALGLTGQQYACLALLAALAWYYGRRRLALAS